MNQEKMGLFIAKLRKENNMTQYDLAEIIPISRDAVSKWERGKRCPEPECLVKLSEVFNVTINELLYGEKATDNNNDIVNEVSIKLYEERHKKQKALKALVAVILLLIFSFLAYYFVNTYNSLKVYHIYYESDDINVRDGVLVMTNEKLYFNLGGILSNYEIKEMELFYKEKNGNNVPILKTDEDNIIFNDFKGYNEYLNFNNIMYIINNLYLKILLPNDEIDIKLKYNKKLSNDYFFPKYEDNATRDKINYDKETVMIEKNIKSNFFCNEDFCNSSKDNYELIYILKSRVLTITSKDDNQFEWIYNFENKQLILQEYIEGKIANKYVKSLNDNKCELGNCTNMGMQINIFNDIIKSI